MMHAGLKLPPSKFVILTEEAAPKVRPYPP